MSEAVGQQEPQTNYRQLAYEYLPEVMAALLPTFATSPEQPLHVLVPSVGGFLVSKLAEKWAGQSPAYTEDPEAYHIIVDELGIPIKRARQLHKGWIQKVHDLRNYVVRTHRVMQTGKSPGRIAADGISDGNFMELTGSYYESENERMGVIEGLIADDSKVTQLSRKHKFNKDLWAIPTDDERAFLERRISSIREVDRIGREGFPDTKNKWGDIEDKRVDVGVYVDGVEISSYQHARDAYITYHADDEFNAQYKAFSEKVNEGIRDYKRIAERLKKLPRRKGITERKELLDKVLNDEDIPLEIKWIQLRSFSDILLTDLRTHKIIGDNDGLVRGENYRKSDEVGYEGLDVDRTINVIDIIYKAELIIDNFKDDDEDHTDHEDVEAKQREETRVREREYLVKAAGTLLAAGTSLSAAILVKLGMDPFVASTIATGTAGAIAAGATYTERRYAKNVVQSDYGDISKIEEIRELEESERVVFVGENLVTNLLKEFGIQIDSSDGVELTRLSQTINRYLAVTRSQRNPIVMLRDQIEESTINRYELTVKLEEARGEMVALRTNPIEFMLNRMVVLNNLDKAIDKAPALVSVNDRIPVESRTSVLEVEIEEQALRTLLLNGDFRYKVISLLEKYLPYDRTQLASNSFKYAEDVNVLIREELIARNGKVVRNWKCNPNDLHLLLVEIPEIIPLLRDFRSKAGTSQATEAWKLLVGRTFPGEGRESYDLIEFSLGQQLNDGIPGLERRKVQKQTLMHPEERLELNTLVAGFYDKSAGRILPVVDDLKVLNQVLNARRAGKHFWRNSSTLLARIGLTDDAAFIRSYPADTPLSEIIARLEKGIQAEPQGLHAKITNRLLQLSIEDLNSEVAELAKAS